jgi:hypothetical protein
MASYKVDSKFSIKKMDQSLQDKVVNGSFSVAKSSVPTKDVSELYRAKFDDVKLEDCKNSFLRDDIVNFKRGNYSRLFYETSKFYDKLDCLTSGKTIIIIEQDECYVNHVKTIASVIQFCLTALTYALNKNLKPREPFVLSDLTCIPGFMMSVSENGLIDCKKINFVNHVDGLPIDRNLELFDFNFKMLIEGYSSPDIKCRRLTADQKRDRDEVVNNYLLTDNDELIPCRYIVYNKNGLATSHALVLNPVVPYIHIRTVRDLLKLIYKFHVCQGLVYKYVGQSGGFVSNAEHGNGKNPVFKIGDGFYEICYLIDNHGFPEKFNYKDRDNFVLKENKCKKVTESRHYGSDVESTFNGYNATFGKGNRFDIMLVK